MQKENAIYDGHFIQEYETLTIANNFMFGVVMRNEDLCRRLLDMKSVRLDV